MNPEIRVFHIMPLPLSVAVTFCLNSVSNSLQWLIARRTHIRYCDMMYVYLLLLEQGSVTCDCNVDVVSAFTISAKLSDSDESTSQLQVWWTCEIHSLSYKRDNFDGGRQSITCESGVADQQKYPQHVRAHTSYSVLNLSFTHVGNSLESCFICVCQRAHPAYTLHSQ